MQDWTDANQLQVMPVEDVALPVVIMGTSPFMGAGQFGERSFFYRQTFYDNPENITSLLRYVASSGVVAVQLMLYPPIIKAFIAARKECEIELLAVPTIGPHEVEADLQTAKDLKAPVAILHGALVDHLDLHQLSELCDKIRAEHLIPGLATHAPLKSVPLLEKSHVDYGFWMAPLNPAGYMLMDRDKTISIYESCSKPILAKKTLAAGRISPSQALPFITTVKTVKWVTIGITSEQEADETLAEARRIWERN
ncbi:hypothetical protein ACFL27_17045 [candidate division CSSED10-310 bacterium]|uniref:Uncharacterized protein n=1 Tax=candidate division CSSED10-310 bacterium TaxID=2855610 RepID=A0ABV6Z0D4_UNCC1